VITTSFVSIMTSLPQSRKECASSAACKEPPLTRLNIFERVSGVDILSHNYDDSGWLFCKNTTLPISQCSLVVLPNTGKAVVALHGRCLFELRHPTFQFHTLLLTTFRLCILAMLRAFLQRLHAAFQVRALDQVLSDLEQLCEDTSLDP